MENLEAKKEYLAPQNAGGFMHKQAYDQGHIPDSWIEIPEGSDYAFDLGDEVPLIFYKDTEDGLYCTCDGNWQKSKRNSIAEVTANLIWKREQSDATASPNDIARTAEVHREHKLSNELNDICAEFGCPIGMDRMTWLRDRLRGTRKPETLYHYSASINTARGTVAYDGVITFPGRITGIEDYHQARAEIAKDGNVAPEQVNVHSLSIVS